MEKLTNILNAVDAGQDYLAKNKKFFMSIITIIIPLYLASVSKVDTINLEVILILAQYTVPLLMMISVIFDTITIRNIKVWFKKCITTTAIYMTIYTAILILLNKFF